MDWIEKVNEIDKVLKEIKENIKRIKENNNEEEYKPKINEEYWYFDKDVEDVQSDCMYDIESDSTRYNNNVIFKTKQEAEEYKEYYLAKKKAINEFSAEEWKNSNINKYYLCFGYVDSKIYINYNYQIKSLISYFRTKRDCIDYIKKYKKFICKEYGVKESEVSIDE